MNKTFVQVAILLIVATASLGILITTPAQASHVTCINGSDKAYCGVSMDWMDLFSKVEGPSQGNLDSDANAKYRYYYQGIGIALNKSIEDVLTGESMPVAGANSWWQGRAFENPIGYPEYRYEIHVWNDDNYDRNCVWVGDDNNQEDRQAESPYMRVEEGKDVCGANSNNGGMVQNRYEASWSPESGGFSIGNDKKGSLNKFEVDTVSADVYVPGDSRIVINIYPTSNRNNKIGQAVFDGEDIRTITSGQTTRETVNLEFNSNADSYINSYHKNYYTSLKMYKGSEGQNPKFGGEVIFTRSYPLYRVSSLPFSIFPKSGIQNLNNQMFANFNQEYFTPQGNASNWQVDTSRSPRLDENSYERGTAPENDDHFQDSSKVVFHHGYAEIATIQPSVLVSGLSSNNYYTRTGQNENSYSLSGYWGRLAASEGTVDVVYDVAVDAAPKDQDNFSGSPADGNLRWSYNYDKDDVTFEIEFGYTKGDAIRGVSERVKIKEVKRDKPGRVQFNYDKSDYDESEINTFYVEMDAEVTYNIDYDEYVVETSDCPNDDNTTKTGYQLPDAAPSDASSCTSSIDDYVDREYWKNLNSAPSGFDSSVTYKMSNLGQEAYDSSRPIGTPEVREFDDDDFKYKRAYIPGQDRIYFERNVEDNSLQETRWTQIVGTGVSQRESVFINASDKQFNSSIEVPRVAGVNSGGVRSPFGSGEYSPSDVDNDGQTEFQPPESNFVIPGKIESEYMDVTLDLFIIGPTQGLEGPTGFLSPRVDVQVNGENVRTIELQGSETSRESYRKIEGIDITSEVDGDRRISVNFTYTGEEPQKDLRIDYVVNINTDRELNKIKSRWSYATFRNSRWDTVYEFTEDCNGAEACYNYSNHSIPIADNKINNGDRRGFAGGGPPDNITAYFPSRAHPVEAYLVPTTDTMLTQRSGQSNTVYPAIPREDGSTSETVASIAETLIQGADYVERGEVSPPLESNICAPAPVPNSDNNEWKRYCDMYSGYLASQNVESAILEQKSASELDEGEISRVRQNIEDELQKTEETDGRGRKYNSPVNLSGTVQHSDYRPLRNETTREYYSLVKFEVLLNQDATSWQIAGDASWHKQSLGEPSAEYLFDKTTLEIDRIKNPMEEIPEQKREKLRSQDVGHEFITEDSPDDAIQLKITLKDEHGYPVNLNQRKFLFGPEKTSKIEVSNARKVGSESWINESYLTNENGTIYVTAQNPQSVENSENDEITAYYSGNVHDWWTHDSNKRLLTESSAEIQPAEYTSGSETSSDWGDILNLIVAGIFIVGGFLFVLARIARTNPQVNVSAFDLARLLSEPFSGAISQFVVYLISLLTLSFLFLLLASLFLGGDINPFNVFFG